MNDTPTPASTIEALPPNFFPQASGALLSNAIRLVMDDKWLDKKMPALLNYTKVVGYTLNMSAIEKTINALRLDLEFTAQRRKTLPSAYKISGLFTYHVMRYLPIGLTDCAYSRKANAYFAFKSSIDFLKNSNCTLWANKTLEYSKVVKNLIFLLEERTANGENIALMYKIWSKANLRNDKEDGKVSAGKP